MLKGFKDFLLRGNIVELAVAVVIGTAFTAVVTAVTTGILQPVISVFGGHTVNGLGFRLISDKPATFIAISPIISALINFLTVAAVLYFGFMAPMKAIVARAKRQEEKVVVTELQLLAEIRDLLREQRDAGSAAELEPEPKLEQKVAVSASD